MKVQIGKLFNLEKGSLQSTKCSEGKYTFITAAEEWKTHNEYAHECEALIFAAAASGSLGRTHYINDKFISSDLCFIMTPKQPDKYPVNLQFYHFVFNALKNDIVAKTKSGTSKESINQKNIKAYKLPYFDLKQQNFWIGKLVHTKEELSNLSTETTHQQTLLKKLRQSILQDAISGKLTKKWRKENPDVEPASELLKRIKEEKERLVKEKIIKKQKPLPPITENEIPFELPKGWVWCRLGEICDFITKGTTPKAHDLMPNGEIPFLKVYNIVNQTINFEYRPQYISKEVNEKFSRSHVYSGDVLMNIVGPPLGKVAIVPNSYEVWNINQALAVFRPVISGINKFLYYYLCEGAVIYKIVTLGVVGQDNISLQQSREIVFALPAIYEIPVINKKIEDCFAFCEKLEKQIDKSYNCANSLQQAVLKEAFEG